MPAPTTMAVTGTVESPDATAGVGEVRFKPLAPPPSFVNNGNVVVVAVVRVALVAGAVPGGFVLVRCPQGYQVAEHPATGAPQRYTIPDQAGPVDLSAFH